MWAYGTLMHMCMLACRAPLLFAALLQRAGVRAELLPLLAEPAAAALQGLSISARTQRPHLAKPFLQVRLACQQVLQTVRDELVNQRIFGLLLRRNRFSCALAHMCFLRPTHVRLFLQ